MSANVIKQEFLSSLFAEPFSANPKPLPVKKSTSNSTSTSVVKNCTDCKNHIALIDDLKDVISSEQQEKNLLQIILDEQVIIM